jgi:hypothetical protein
VEDGWCWRCELCGDDDNGEWIGVAACPSSPDVPVVMVKLELQSWGDLWQ